MKAIVISRPGGTDVLELREVPEPETGPKQVRVRVHASAMNRADLLQRRGLYPAPPDSPSDIPGLEFAGVVESCGRRVRGFSPGDRVMGISGGGAQAEYLAIDQGLCVRIPDRLGWEEAAAVPEAFVTACDALVSQGRLAPGETVLVHAAASGVGTAAVQVARAAGCRSIGLSRTEDKRRRLESLGVDSALDPAREDIVEAIRRHAGSGGVDLVLDLVGAAAWETTMATLATRGRVVVVGVMGGSSMFFVKPSTSRGLLEST